MENRNQSKAIQFILEGVSGVPEMQIPLFFVFCLMYLTALTGNLFVITLIIQSPALHRPMYSFLCNLSILDVCSSTVTQPKLLSMLLTGNSVTYFTSCILQLYFFICFTAIEMFSLTAMAYDRYAAICKPLNYSVLINTRTCVLLCVSSWLFGFVEPIPHISTISQLSFCGPLIINHFYCDVSVLLKLSCTDTGFIDNITYFLGSVVGCFACICIVTSYIYIISTILKIQSSKGRQKCFSTCVSHLTVVILFYGSLFLNYMRPSSQYSSSEEKPFAVVYTALIPMINPFIYTLRNKDVHMAIWKAGRTNR
ncbi:hypothetical protein XENTR_v10022175 [Xenopus tropicalis]|nr:hypothetical protein XENTR_v10022175 [Xenopus tropicalis]